MEVQLSQLAFIFALPSPNSPNTKTKTPRKRSACETLIDDHFEVG
jgi:hypothetical protein